MNSGTNPKDIDAEELNERKNRWPNKWMKQEINWSSGTEEYQEKNQNEIKGAI